MASYGRVKVMSEPCDSAPTHPFVGPEPSFEIKEGLRGQVLIVPRYDVLYVICLYTLFLKIKIELECQ